MLGVAALLASSSMAAIELITLYARLDNAVHKNALPPSPPQTHSSQLPSPPIISRCDCSALAAEKARELL